MFPSRLTICFTYTICGDSSGQVYFDTIKLDRFGDIDRAEWNKQLKIFLKNRLDGILFFIKESTPKYFLDYAKFFDKEYLIIVDAFDDAFSKEDLIIDYSFDIDIFVSAILESRIDRPKDITDGSSSA